MEASLLYADVLFEVLSRADISAGLVICSGQCISRKAGLRQSEPPRTDSDLVAKM